MSGGNLSGLEMTLSKLVSGLCLTSLLWACGEQPKPAPAPEAAITARTDSAAVTTGTVETQTHLLEEIAPGVYFATGTGSVNVASNALVIVNEDDVVVVDSHITADAGRALLNSIRAITDKPISYLINSHFHFDHAHGNQVFAENTDIIGHEFTREAMLNDPLNGATYQTIGGPIAQTALLTAINEQITSEQGDVATLKRQRTVLERHIEALPAVVPTPPNITLTDTMTLRQGSREIRLIHPGRGHTGGDVIVYLPAEKVVFTGDLLYAGAPYLGDGFADEMPDTLDVVRALEVNIIAGGHGPLMYDKTHIDRSQAYLRQYWNQVADSYEKGLSAAEAATAIEFSGYQEFAAFQVAAPAVVQLEVARMYERMKAHDAK